MLIIYTIVSIILAWTFLWNMKKDPLYNGKNFEMIMAMVLGILWPLIATVVILIILSDLIVITPYLESNKEWKVVE